MLQVRKEEAEAEAAKERAKGPGKDLTAVQAVMQREGCTFKAAKDILLLEQDAKTCEKVNEANAKKVNLDQFKK